MFKSKGTPLILLRFIKDPATWRIVMGSFQTEHTSCHPEHYCRYLNRQKLPADFRSLSLDSYEDHYKHCLSQ